MTGELSDDDRGKTVVNDTERIGTVTDVRGGTVYVDPDWDHIPEDLRDALGWAEGGNTHTFDEDAVTAVQNSQIRIREDQPSQSQ